MYRDPLAAGEVLKIPNDIILSINGKVLLYVVDFVSKSIACINKRQLCFTTTNKSDKIHTITFVNKHNTVQPTELFGYP